MQLQQRPRVGGTAGRSSSCSRRCVIVCAAHSCTGSRRSLLVAAPALLAAAAAWAPARPALAVCAVEDTEEAGDACRAAELARDQTQQGDYKQLTGGPARKLAPNVPVSDLNSEYARATRDLAAEIDAYITLDVYDRQRQPLIKRLKTDAVTWVSKYARGGSVRSQSARNVYIACDSVLGHLASNGLAPLPSSKAKLVREKMSAGLEFLGEGR